MRLLRYRATRKVGWAGWRIAVALVAFIGFGMLGVAFGGLPGEHHFKLSQVQATTFQATGSRADDRRCGDVDGICACCQGSAFSCGCAVNCVQALTVAAGIAPPTALGAPLLVGPANQGAALNIVGLPFRPPRAG